MASDLIPQHSIDPSFICTVMSSKRAQSTMKRLNNLYKYYLNGNNEHVVSLSQVLIDEAWEEMNTGHWKDVDINWRYLYSYASLLKCLCLYNLHDVGLAIQTADLGLLMGAPIFDNILANVVVPKLNSLAVASCGKGDGEHDNDVPCNEPVGKKMKKRKEKRNHPHINNSCRISSIECPSLIDFHTHYIKEEKPVIIRNAMGHWPAMQEHRWNVPYIRSVAGFRTVPVEIGAQYTSGEWTQKLQTVNEFIDKYILSSDNSNSGEIGYLAQHQLFEQVPQLKDDIKIPDYCCLSDVDNSSDDVMVHAWFGPEGTVSPLHHDPYHNLLAQVVGSKYIRLYNRSLSELLYPHVNSILSNTSHVDVEDWDENEYPKFREADYVECILSEGEMLYIPPKWWHYVRSLSLSFSVSFWWK